MSPSSPKDRGESAALDPSQEFARFTPRARAAVTAAHQAAVIPYDLEARKALELTFREALRLGHNYIGTEHMLLALLEWEDGDGPLSASGLDKAGVEADLLAALASL